MRSLDPRGVDGSRGVSQTRQYTTFVSQTVDSSDLITYAIVGTGMMGREHIGNIAHIPGLNVAVVVDPNLESQILATSLCSKGTPAYKEYEIAVSNVPCDAVVIAAPNYTHEMLALEAIESGKHVLIEKPLTTTVEGCFNVERRAANSPHQVVGVGLEYRFMAPTKWLLDKVHSGHLGDVRLVTIIEHRFPFLDKVGSWNRFNENTGGSFVEKCCHFFDLMYQIFKTEPTAVMAMSARTVNHRDESYEGRVPDILDNGYVLVEFGDGKCGMLELCMFAEGSRDEQQISVVGDSGKAEVRIPSNECSIGARSVGRVGIKTEVLKSDAPYQGLHHGASYYEHLEFRRAIRGENHFLATLRDGTRSVAIGVAAQRSIEERRRVTLEEVGYVV